MIVDLHVHSHYSSDGRLTISEILEYYSPEDIVGLTDHETIGGWNEFQDEAEKRGLRPILGVEWFADKGKYHILSYFLNGTPNDFNDFMINRRNKERECMHKVFNVFKLKYSNLPAYDDLLELSNHPEKILRLPVLAEAISKISDKEFKEAVFMIRDERGKLPVNQQQETFFANEIITKINEWNALSVLAHPYIENNNKIDGSEVEDKIKLLFQYGLGGIEVLSGGKDNDIQKHLLFLCDELKLLPTIGSDFHYQNKGLIPKHLNDIDESLLKRVKEWLIDKTHWAI